MRDDLTSFPQSTLANFLLYVLCSTAIAVACEILLCLCFLFFSPLSRFPFVSFFALIEDRSSCPSAEPGVLLLPANMTAFMLLFFLAIFLCLSLSSLFHPIRRFLFCPVCFFFLCGSFFSHALGGWLSSVCYIF